MQLRCARGPSLMFTRSRKIENTLKKLPKTGIRAAKLILWCGENRFFHASKVGIAFFLESSHVSSTSLHSLRTSLFDRGFLQKAPIYWLPENVDFYTRQSSLSYAGCEGPRMRRQGNGCIF